MDQQTIKMGKYVVKMPSEGVTVVGRNIVAITLAKWNLKPLPDDWSWQWQVGGKGKYVGSFPKRVGKYYRQARSGKLTAQQLSEIGNLASANIPKAETYYIEFAPNFNWSPGQFGDYSSCYWSCHSSAREMILGAGGFTIRLYRDDEYNNSKGIGRAWIMPHKVVQLGASPPTISQCYIVANGYGLETLPIARIVALHLNHAYYHKMKLLNNKTCDGCLWINGGNGYLVGQQEAVVSTEEVDLQIEDIDCTKGCCVCDCEAEDGCDAPNGDYLCEECWSENYCYCMSCDETVDIDDSESHDDDFYCVSCFTDKFFQCEHCRRYFSKFESVVENGRDYCSECYCELFRECEECAGLVSSDEIEMHNDRYLCHDCHETETETEEAAI